MLKLLLRIASFHKEKKIAFKGSFHFHNESSCVNKKKEEIIENVRYIGAIAIEYA